LLADVETAQAGEHHVENDERRTMQPDCAERLVAAIADGDVKPIAPQDFLKAEENVRVVFDDKDFRFHGGVKRKT
jgi:hypothetical protein